MTTADPEPTRRRGLVAAAVNRLGPAVIREIDMDAVVAELDVEAIAERLDVNAIVERLDVNAIADRLDLDRLVSRLDVDAIAARLDMDAIVHRLDVEAVADRLDLDRLVSRLDMAQLTADATQDVALSGLDLFRRQLIRADRSVEATVERLPGRHHGERPAAPGHLDVTIPVAVDHPPLEPLGDAVPQRRAVSGHYAGPVTRLLALVADVVAGFGTYGFAGATTIYLLSTITGVDLTIASGGWLTAVLLTAWMVLWFWLPVSYFGRTPAMALLGIAVVRRGGDVVSGRRALLRALVLPVSILPLGLGLLGMVIGRERRTLHDVVAGTVEVYDWGAREAEQPVTIRAQLQARVRRRPS